MLPAASDWRAHQKLLATLVASRCLSCRYQPFKRFPTTPAKMQSCARTHTHTHTQTHTHRLTSNRLKFTNSTRLKRVLCERLLIHVHMTQQRYHMSHRHSMLCSTSTQIYSLPLHPREAAAKQMRKNSGSLPRVRFKSR